MRKAAAWLMALLTGGGWLLWSAGPAESFSPWSSYDRTSGLVDNRVQVVARDGEGKLWVGTRGGLSRFDGEQWTNLTRADGLPDNDINTIFFDPDGNVWLGTSRGFGLFRDRQWSRLGLPGAREGERVAVVADGKGSTWFGHAGGLMRFDGGEGGLVSVPQLAGVAVSGLLTDREGGLWVGTEEGMRFHDGLSWTEFSTRDGLSPGAVTVLLEDSRGTIWIGTESGLSEYDGIGWTSYGAEDDLPNTHVTSLAEDREGRIWVGTMGGAGWYDGYEWIWLGPDSGIPSEEVLALSADLNGSIWIGTSHGLAKFDTSWVSLPPLGYDEKAPRGPILRRRDGVLLLAADRGFLEKEGRQAEYVGPSDKMGERVTVWVEDGEDNVWIGSDRGLYLYDGASLQHFLPPEYEREIERDDYGNLKAVKVRRFDRYNGLKGEKVTSLQVDEEGGIWVGTTEGLSRYADGQWELLEENEALGRGEITALAGEGGDLLWAGTPDGLWVRRDGEWLRVGGPSGTKIISLAYDRDGNLWAGTDRGVSRRDGEEWRSYASEDGLVGGNVAALYQDLRGAVWFGTEAGVAKFDGTNWSAFSETDGLHANAITSIVEAAGDLWFGSAGGVSVYRPDRAPPDTRVKNAPRDPVGASSFLFEFAGSDFETEPSGMRYSWKLDDGEWSPFTTEPRVTVKDLANGTHTFLVRSMDKGLNVDPTPATVPFQVDTGLFDLELVRARFLDLYASLYQFYAADPDFEKRPVAVVDVRNKFDRPLRVKFSLLVPGLMDFPSDRVATVPPGEVLPVPLRIELNDEVLAIEKTAARQILLTMQYSLRGELKESSFTQSVTIFEKHSMTWEEPERIGLYVTHLDETVERFARSVVRRFRDQEMEAVIYDNLLRGIVLFDALGAHGVRYIADPENPYGGITSAQPVLDLIRFPRETLRLKSGDCDDVSVLYAALLQNIGIDTALVDVHDHVFVMFDTGLRSHQAGQLSRDSSLLYIDEGDRIWVPVETTLLGKSFTTAWKTGARMLQEKKYEIINIGEAWKKYSPLHLPYAAAEVAIPERSEIWPLFAEDLKLQEENLISAEVKPLRQKLENDPADVSALNSLGVLLAKNGYLRQAEARFRKVVELAPSFPGGFSNLGNVLYERGRYEEAVASYLEALRLAPDSSEVHVELALTYCELGRFDQARGHYRAAMRISPGLEKSSLGRQDGSGGAGGDGAGSPGGGG